MFSALSDLGSILVGFPPQDWTYSGGIWGDAVRTSSLRRPCWSRNSARVMMIRPVIAGPAGSPTDVFDTRKPIVFRRSRRARWWRVIALLSATGLGGVNNSCSFVFVDGPPAEHAKMPYFDCTSTYGLPVADGFIGLSGVLGAGQALGQSKQAYADKNGGASRNAAAGIDIALAGVLAASAVYGIVQTERCDRAKEDLRARIFAPTLHRPQLPPPFPTSPASPASPASPTPLPDPTPNSPMPLSPGSPPPVSPTGDPSTGAPTP